MTLKMFSIYDKATEVFNQPFFMLTKAEALRAFIKMATDQDTQIANSPHDFHLYYLGTYDNSVAMVNQDKGIEDFGSAAQLTKQDKVLELKEHTA